MQIHQEGSVKAQEFAAKVEQIGIKDRFNTDPGLAWETFPLWSKYPFLSPQEKIDKNQFANLVRLCVHFEIETISFLSVMGMPPNAMFVKTVYNFLTQNTIDQFKNRSVDTELLEKLAKDISKEVYLYLSKELDLPQLEW